MNENAMRMFEDYKLRINGKKEPTYRNPKSDLRQCSKSKCIFSGLCINCPYYVIPEKTSTATTTNNPTKTTTPPVVVHNTKPYNLLRLTSEEILAKFDELFSSPELVEKMKND